MGGENIIKMILYIKIYKKSIIELILLKFNKKSIIKFILLKLNKKHNY